MFSLAIVSFSLCSAAISSSTGATILHGPHHSAQKSTRTGLSLPSTSLAKLASVTVLVLPAMVVLSVVVLGLPVPTDEPQLLCPGTRRMASLQGPAPSLRGVGGREVLSALVEGLGQPALGVDRGGGAGAGRGDRLAVDVVDHVAAGEDTVDVRARGGV